MTTETMTRETTEAMPTSNEAEAMTGDAPPFPLAGSVGDNPLFRELLSQATTHEVELSSLTPDTPAWNKGQEAAGLLWEAIIAVADAHTARAVMQATR